MLELRSCATALERPTPAFHGAGAAGLGNPWGRCGGRSAPAREVASDIIAAETTNTAACDDMDADEQAARQHIGEDTARLETETRALLLQPQAPLLLRSTARVTTNDLKFTGLTQNLGQL